MLYRTTSKSFKVRFDTDLSPKQQDKHAELLDTPYARRSPTVFIQYTRPDRINATVKREISLVLLLMSSKLSLV